MKCHKNIPLFCRIKKKISIPSPSAIYFCGLGYKFRPQRLCKNCSECRRWNNERK